MSAKKGKKNVKSDAEKAAEFKKFAVKHTTAALKAIARLGNLGNKYSATQEQVKTLQGAFEDALTVAFDTLKGKKTAAVEIEL